MRTCLFSPPSVKGSHVRDRGNRLASWQWRPPREAIRDIIEHEKTGLLVPYNFVGPILKVPP